MDEKDKVVVVQELFDKEVLERRLKLLHSNSPYNSVSDPEKPEVIV